MWNTRGLVAGLLLSMTMAPARAAVSYYLATDVPVTLGSTDFTPAQIVRSENGTYTLELAFGGALAQLRAVNRRPDGTWLLVPAVAADLGGAVYGPRDVIRFDGVSAFSPFFDGSLAGVPDYASIDAAFLDGAVLVLSFDVPVKLGGVEYAPSDLVRYSGGTFSLFWSGAAAGVPDYTNLLGADRDSGGTLVVTFDVPTNLGGVEYLPGQLVRWNGGTSFSLYFADPSWPVAAGLRGFGFVPASGSVPDGGGVPGTMLRVGLTEGNLTLSWGASCAAGDSDYEVYQGSLVRPFVYDHTEKLCTTGGATSASFAAPAGSVYFLIAPRNSIREGSYGRASGGAERPQGTTACLPQEIALACP